MSAVYQPRDGPGLRVEVFHLCPIPEVVDSHFALGVAENELAFPDLISRPPTPQFNNRLALERTLGQDLSL